jgi:hypothetical protein
VNRIANVYRTDTELQASGSRSGVVESPILWHVTACCVVFAYQRADGLTAAHCRVIQEERVSLMVQFRPDLP